MLERNKSICLLVILVGSISMSVNCIMAIFPTGAALQNTRNETALNDTPMYHDAYAGNVSEIVLYGYSTTQTWQGYYGNVTGTIQLADNDDNIMYNWSDVNPRGEVYASTNNTLYWSNMTCFNHTATGDYSTNETPGETEQYGKNYTLLMDEFNITSDAVDNINNTFVLGLSHNQFYTASLEFGTGECLSTQVFDDQGKGEDDKYEEVLLWEPITGSLVFTSILNKDDPLGFDQGQHDFEMLVIENGHSTSLATTTYYFWVDLG
jgi:hypothetical protein